jgi:hypothetical protein
MVVFVVFCLPWFALLRDADFEVTSYALELNHALRPIFSGYFEWTLLEVFPLHRRYKLSVALRRRYTGEIGKEEKIKN